jgi:nucleoside-diphosphate-sugar epimerase
MMLRTEAQAVDLMKIFDGTAGRVVIASSIDVYRNFGLAIGSEIGNVYNARLTEDAPLRETLYPYRNRATGPDDWQYDYDKIPIEREILAHKSLPGTVLRLPMVYGPHDSQHRLYPYLKRMLDNRPAILLDENQIDARWIRGYVEDIAAGIALAVTDSRARDRIYNLCQSSAMTEREWINHIAAVVGWNGRVIGLPKDKLPEHLRDETRFEAHLNADSRRIRNELGYKEIIDFSEGLKRTVAWEKDNPPPSVDPDDYNYEAEDKALSEIDGAS